MKPLTYSLLLFFALTVCGLAESEFDSPQSTLKTYLEACSQGDYAAAEACYTKSSRKLVEEQMKGIERDPELLKGAYQHLSQVEYREERVNGKRAILWPSDERIPPFLFRIQDEKEG